MPDAYFIVEYFDHKPAVVWSCISDVDNAIDIFNDVLYWELLGNDSYTYHGYIKPGFYTFQNADNYYIDDPVKSFRLPDSVLSLVPVSYLKK